LTPGGSRLAPVDLGNNGQDTPLTFRWLGQAGFLLSSGGQYLLVDPWFSDHDLRIRSAPLLAELPEQIGWLLVTHEHGDHLDLPALPALLGRFPRLRIVVPAPLRDRVAAAEPRARVLSVQPGDRLEVGAVVIHVVHAWHGVGVADGYSDGHALRADALTPFVGYVIAFPEITVYHSGDTLAGTGMVDELRPLRVDVALLPTNGRSAIRERAGIVGNLDAREAVEMAAQIGARVLVPMHYDMVRGNRARVASVVEAAKTAGRSLAVIIPVRSTDIALGLPRRSQTRSAKDRQHKDVRPSCIDRDHPP
jgi:L-ascorbate metabolism protein UlaG (beta-lactamase superfamily)